MGNTVSAAFDRARLLGSTSVQPAIMGLVTPTADGVTTACRGRGFHHYLGPFSLLREFSPTGLGGRLRMPYMAGPGRLIRLHRLAPRPFLCARMPTSTG